MTDDPDVSVVLGVRNGGARIEAAVRSILGQRDVRLELVVVDDGSTDRTPEILGTFAAVDSRVRVFRQAALGLTRALIHGCDQARGRFIARHDADEESHPDRLRRQLTAFVEHPELALVSCWTAYVGPGGELLRVQRQACAADWPVSIFELADEGRSVRVTAGPSSHGSAFFPAALYREIGGYRAAFAAGQDWDLWLRLCQHGKFLMVGDTLLSTTVEEASLSFAVRDLQMEFAEISAEALLQRLHGRSEDPTLARAAALSRRLETERLARRRQTEALGLYHIGESLRRNRHRAALSYLLRAVRRNPLLLRAWIRAAQAALAPLRSQVDEK